MYILYCFLQYFLLPVLSPIKKVSSICFPQRLKGANLLEEIHGVLKNWIKGQLFGFLFIAKLTGLGLWIIGWPMIVTLALISGLLNFIPNFGPVIALIPAGLIGLLQNTTTAILVLCLYTFIQLVQSAVT